jgi:hypothetical protein
MKNFKKAKEIIIEKTIEDLVERYNEIVEEINDNIYVNEDLVKEHVKECVDFGSMYDVCDFDFSKTVEENIEEYFDKRKFDDHDWWLDWNTPEELYELGIKNNWIEVCV